ncbi:MAG: DUF3795 domain-containing protein [Sedimentisphaerales bacterium]|nr:DUF3795 domain-containing protein [Sedimentisphaerales bacterium]
MTAKITAVGACGIYCGRGLDFRALAENDEYLRQQATSDVSRELNRGISPDQVGCEDCWGDIHNEFSASLSCGIRQCVPNKGYITCAECKDFPCDTHLLQFDAESQHVLNIQAIRQKGLKNWREEQ